jgi:hypothetical protein
VSLRSERSERSPLSDTLLDGAGRAVVTAAVRGREIVAAAERSTERRSRSVLERRRSVMSKNPFVESME